MATRGGVYAGKNTFWLWIIQFAGKCYEWAFTSKDLSKQVVGFVFGVGIYEELTKIVPLALVLFAGREAPLARRVNYRAFVALGFVSGLAFGISEALVAYAPWTQPMQLLDDAYPASLGVPLAFGLNRWFSCVPMHALWGAADAAVLWMLARQLLSAKSPLVRYGILVLAVLAMAVVHGLYDIACVRNIYAGVALSIGSVFLVQWIIGRNEVPLESLSRVTESSPGCESLLEKIFQLRRGMPLTIAVAFSGVAALFWVSTARDSADAQLKLGLAYSTGQGVHQDDAKAVELFSKAAKQGCVEAQYNLAAMYTVGRGVEQDHKEAVRWLTKAALQGHAAAQVSLGVAYKNGNGVEQDYSKAIEWFAKAANQGDTDAQCDLALAYASGNGVSQDDKKAAQWWGKAAAKGDALAQACLGRCYSEGRGVELDYDQAFKWDLRSAQQMCPAGQYNLGLCYSEGRGVKLDNEQAFKWFSMSAQQGCDAAQCSLGVSYMLGQGVTRDVNKAREWLAKSAQQGNNQAKTILESLVGAAH